MSVDRFNGCAGQLVRRTPDENRDRLPIFLIDQVREGVAVQVTHPHARARR